MNYIDRGHDGCRAEVSGTTSILKVLLGEYKVKLGKGARDYRLISDLAAAIEIALGAAFVGAVRR